MHMFLRILLGSFLFISVSAKAAWAAGTFKDFQTWSTLLGMGSLGQGKLEPFKYWLEGQERAGDNSSRASQTLLRTGLGYAATENTTLWLGYAWVYTEEPLTSNPFQENRIWQQVLWTKKIQELGFTVRSRLEERYLETSENTAYRYRQYFKIVVPLVQTAKLNLASTEEIFWHLNNFNGLNNHGFDQNRFFLGLNYKMTSTLTTEIGHLNQYIRRVNNSNFQSNVLAMNFLLNL
ncbi:hypothetical protein Lbir_3091 [Legionella birminghamensis]|uniref:Protein of uncharacterized function (DUF2490) n=1 Tax=Legionella birminghamensis TaxID=28083 RepID=A0A378ICM3_9GAMM|nr:DUF2490 domain-containing protein [Legionella birminghamensis]KTC66789.1 hypothetical protein Lbir_3091 [Legionella birminghamensis]STX32939.1 Protein of uncharacterised function (DUF2490) [Legionella birminghamensis]